MRYFSLQHNAPIADFKEATINGQAPDKGLYFPQEIPKINSSLIDNIENISNQEIAFEVIKPYVGEAIPENILQKIVEETVSFPIPLVQVSERIAALELYHGPTLAFKDIGARFMSRCLGHFVQESNKKVTVLVATSGDTGGAVANGFYGVDGVEVVILYPSGKVSTVQEKQLTTLGKNITALEVDGNFDDCQQMVKDIFNDAEVRQKLFLTSANSINVARWLPQQFYYFYAYKQWAEKDNPPVISVPSGNFGNICAGILANASGLPVKHFVAACNANDTVPQFMQTNQYLPKKAVATISNAMDVADPSNFVRVLEIFSQQMHALKNVVTSYSIDDNTTAVTLKEVYTKYSYLCDTHGAVAYKALDMYLEKNTSLNGIFLETAHPIKFYDVVEPIIKESITIPNIVLEQLKLEKKSIKISCGTKALKDFLFRNK